MRVGAQAQKMPSEFREFVSQLLAPRRADRFAKTYMIC